MLLFREFFKTQSVKKYTPKRTKQHHIFKFFSGELAYVPELSITYMHATMINMFFCMKTVVFYSRFFQNTHQNASIVNVFKNFFYDNYPVASVYLKYFFFI